MFKVKTPNGEKKVTFYSTHSKGSVLGTAAGTAQDVVGGLAGSVAGSFLGGPVSLAGGLASLAIGHFTGIQVLKPFGLGMALTTGYECNKTGQGQTPANTDGFDPREELTNATQRASNWWDHFKGKFTLKQFVKEKVSEGQTPGSPETVQGIEDYFAQLDQFNAQVTSEAMQRVNRIPLPAPTPAVTSPASVPMTEDAFESF